MDHKRYKIVSSVLGGSSETLYGCKRCGLVSFDMDLHEDVFHAEPKAVALPDKSFTWDGTSTGIEELIKWWKENDPNQVVLHQGLEGGFKEDGEPWVALVDEVESTSTIIEAGSNLLFNGEKFYLG